MRKARKGLKFSNVVACLALFVALGGSAYAEMQLPKNSVGTVQLKKSSVTPPKLSPAAKEALTGKQGPKGDAGPQGPKGNTGAQGEPGPFPATLPAGKTIVGTFDLETTAATAELATSGSISYLYKAPGQTVVYLRSGQTDPNCTGTDAAPTAPAGYTCIYEAAAVNAESNRGKKFENQTGVGLFLRSAAAGMTSMYGTWAATGK